MHCMATLTAQLTFRVRTSVYRRLQEIAKAERRKMNEVARAILERGIVAYASDGELFEPDADGKDGDLPLTKPAKPDSASPGKGKRTA